jgi:hypothetical protein
MKITEKQKEVQAEIDALLDKGMVVESKQETLYSAAITIGLEFGMKPQQSLRLLENLSSLTDGERTYTEIVEALTKK